MHSTHTEKCFGQWKTPSASFFFCAPLSSLLLSRILGVEWEWTPGESVCMCVCFMHGYLGLEFFLSWCLCEYIFVITRLSCKSDEYIWTPPQVFISPIIPLFSPSLLQSSHPSLRAICRTAGRHQLQFLWAAPWSEQGWTVTAGCPPLLVETWLT